jgi:uncharacterized membrane protein
MDTLSQFFFKYSWSTFAKGQLGFANRPAWWVIVLLLLAIGALIYLLYLRPQYRISNLSRGAMIALRTGLIALLAVMLMRPVVVIPSVIPKSTTVAVLTDDSRSMTLQDENGRSRLEAAKELLNPQGSFARGLDDKFKVGLYGFAASTAKLKNPSELKGEGAATDLANAMQEAVKDSTGSPLSALVVISDGGANTARDLGAQLRELKARNLPVFVVGVGSPERFKDAEMVRVNAPRRVLVGSAIIAEALIRSHGYGNTKVTVAVSEDGKALKTENFELKGNEAQTVTIEYTPSSIGTHRYTFEVKPLDGETTLENNVQESLVQVTDDHPKILYLEGEPRWEYGFMRKAFAKNEKNLVLVSSLRSADGKFYRQGVESGTELEKGFPLSDEELFNFQGLVIGSVEANFFTYDQLKWIEQFVARRGGGFLALGGQRSFDSGKYADTPVADLLPLYLSDRPAEPEIEAVSNFKAALTTRGRTHAVTRLAEDRNLSAKAWDELPAITVPETLTTLKPGATLILEARSVNDKNRTIPLLAEERYGRGRSLAFLTNDTWRWKMEMPSQSNAHETFWRQLLRYVVSTTPNQFEVTSEREVYALGDLINVRGEVNDKKWEAIKDAQVSARVIKPSGASVELPLKLNFSSEAVSQSVSPAGTQPSDYRNEFAPDEQGVYKLEMTAKRGGATLGEAQSSFLVTDRTREFNDAAQNIELLKRVALETGGQYFPLNQASQLLEEITHLEGKNSERVSRELWDMPINFLLLIGLASGEWFLRKRRGLA